MHQCSRGKSPPFIGKKHPRQTEFCQETSKLGRGRLEKVIWSDESPFELYATPNRHNDCVWAKTTKDVPRILSVKFPQKIHVWGLMSHQALSELRIIPQGHTVNSLYYRDEILAKTCRDAFNRTANMGPISERPMLGNMSDFIFIQDGAPAHKAKMTQKWCRDNLNGFGRKVTGLGIHRT